MHAACLKSFVRHGHRVVLHGYGAPPVDLPGGVEVADASILVTEDRIRRFYAGGLFALGSDLFRLELMAAGAGIYVDCDCYCVKPLEDEDYLFGWESDDYTANAVLKIPADSPLLAALRGLFATRAFIPPWLTAGQRKYYRRRSLLRRPVPFEEMPWGTTGPKALTYYARKLGLSGKAKPIDEYYPVHFDHTPLLRDPGILLSDLITPRTRVVHLWHHLLLRDPSPPSPGSPLAVIMDSLDS